MITNVVLPIAKELFWGMGVDSISEHNAFTVNYSTSADQDLQLHGDDSELTINICLGNEDFVGGDIIFEGARCDLHKDIKQQEKSF